MVPGAWMVMTLRAGSFTRQVTLRLVVSASSPVVLASSIVPAGDMPDLAMETLTLSPVPAESHTMFSDLLLRVTPVCVARGPLPPASLVVPVPTQVTVA